MKNNYIETINAGEILEREPFFLRTFEERIHNGDSIYIARLEDKTGVIYGTMLQINFNEAMNSLVGNPVYVSGTTSWKNNNVQILIGKMELCKDIDISELCPGITQEEVAKKKEYILDVISKIPEHIPARKLLDTVFNEEMFEKMAERPASLTKGSRFRGGLLSAVVTVTATVMGMGEQYWKHRNAFYTKNVSGTLLVTSCLMYYAAKTYAYTEYPFKRTEDSVLEGMQAIVGNMIAEAEFANERLPEDFKRKLLHVIIAVEDSRIVPVCKEAVIVKNAILTYNDCDSIDDVSATEAENGKSGVIYSKKLNRYVLIGG